MAHCPGTTRRARTTGETGIVMRRVQRLRSVCGLWLLALLMTVVPIAASTAASPPAPAAEKKSCCGLHPTIPDMSRGDDSTEFFVPTMTCVFACLGSDEQAATLTRIFRPIDHRLRPGNGSDGTGAPWGGFTASIEAWSRLNCLEHAADRCAGLEKVETSRLVDITSGDWRLDERVPCPDPETVASVADNGGNLLAAMGGVTPLLSPFQDGSGSLREYPPVEDTPPALPFPALGAVLTGPAHDPTQRNVDTFSYWRDRAITFGEVPDEMTIESEVEAFLLASTGAASPGDFVEMKQKENNIPPRLSCTRVLRARSCFGDCISYPEGSPMIQYMANFELGLENLSEVSVCADNLVTFFNRHEMSDQAKGIFCEKYMGDSLIQGKTVGFTCSSYRIRVDCSPFF